MAPDPTEQGKGRRTLALFTAYCVFDDLAGKRNWLVNRVCVSAPSLVVDVCNVGCCHHYTEKEPKDGVPCHCGSVRLMGLFLQY